MHTAPVSPRRTDQLQRVRARLGSNAAVAGSPRCFRLFSLIVRGVSVEIASQTGPAPRWEKAFGIASLTAALSQGVAFATFTGSPFASVGWFAALTGATVTCTYLALGYAYTKWKATGRLRARAGRRSTASAVSGSVLAVACLLTVNGTATPLNLHDPLRAIGFGGLLMFAAGGVVTTLVTLRSASPFDGVPIAGLAAAVVALVLAVVVARYPVLIPPGVTLAEAAAPHNTLAFLTVGIGLNVPLLLFYNWFAHHTFRGKLDRSQP